MLQKALHKFEHLFEKNLIDEILQIANYIEFKKDDIIIDIGQQITHIPLVASGSIKVIRENTAGQELLLYYVEKGESCSITLNCCNNKSKSDIRAIAENNIELIMLPVHCMDDFMVRYHTWRNFILNNYHNRFQSMIEAIDSLAFMNLEERITKYLFTKRTIQKNNEIKVTHNEIAQEINSSRVVVSRLLKKLEIEGIIQQERQRIYLIKEHL